ncbi:MAG TPA: hypothetical protein VKE41_13105 [Roseiflexaceae bacterium]|nr:hypothetical protein [Roseiflexaceae bacterium]
MSLCIQGQALRAAGQPEAGLAAFERSQERLTDDPYEMARTQARAGVARRQ